MAIVNFENEKNEKKQSIYVLISISVLKTPSACIFHQDTKTRLSERPFYHLPPQMSNVIVCLEKLTVSGKNKVLT